MYTPKFMLCLMALPLCFCTNQPDRVLFQATCNGNELTLMAIDPGALQNHKLYTELTVGNQPPIRPKDRSLPDMMPYDTGIYGRSPWQLIDTSISYSRKNQFHTPRDRVMLYMNPEIYSKKDFTAICHCINTNAAAMVKAMDVEELAQDYQFAGVVFGNAADFTQRFRKREKEYLDILPDGSILYNTDQNLNLEGNIVYNFLGDKIRMPGRRIIINDPHRAAKLNLHDYRNAAGQALDDVFTVKYQAEGRQ